METREYKDLWRQCEARLGALGFTLTANGHEFCEALGTHRKRPIILQALDLQTVQAGLTGLWVATEDEDYVLYESGTDPEHQNHIILHEVGHIVCGHQPESITQAELLAYLLDGLDAEFIRGVLHRGGYSSKAELEAEVFASVLQARSVSPVCDPTVAGQDMADAMTRVMRNIEGGRASE